jgi:hypothetical protein
VFITKKHLSRRTLLKGAGGALALPFLDAMVPAATALAQTAAAPKLRTGFFYIPHGAIMYNTGLGPAMDRWTPSGAGADFKLNTIMASLEPFKKSVTSFDHLENAASNGSVRAYTSTWLSCTTPVSNTGPTLDQVIAGRIGSETTLPSLQVASETTNQQAAGNGNLGAEVSFTAAHACLPTEYRPRRIFTTLFGDGDPAERASIDRQESSLLDFIRDQTRALQTVLGPADRVILDGHLESVRQAEVRVQQDSDRQDEMDRRLGTTMADLHAVDARIPKSTLGRPLDDFDQQVRLIFDLVALAYQMDITRVVTFIMAAEGTNQNYPFIGVPDSFHPLSLHADDPVRIEKLVKIQTWHMEKFAEFLAKMAATPDGQGTLLDHSIFMYGSNMSNSNLHSHYPLPTIVVGGGNGKLKQGGQQLTLPEHTPIANLHLALLNKAGIEQNRFGDSTGMISGI